MSIFIARHGETDHNKNRILQLPNTPLSITGQQQAKLLALRLQSQGITRIISSDYLRAQQTAQALSDISKIGLELNPLLRERNLGDIRGKSYDELAIDPFALDYIPVNGESWDEFHQRVAKAWEFISQQAKLTEGHLLIVTHGLVCRALLPHLSQTSNVKSLSPYGNTSLTKVDAYPPWAIEYLNCTAHLDSNATPDNHTPA